MEPNLTEPEAHSKARAWSWIPSLYFAEGIPYVLVTTLSVIFYKRMGVSNADIALYTSLLYLPWVIKPFWSPVVDILKTKRYWIIIMQFLIGIGLAGVAMTIPAPNFIQYTLAFFWLLAFSSATHDIAADGFYMLGLSKHDQTYFVGIRSTFYRLAMLTGQGLFVILAGVIESRTGLPPVELTVTTSSEETKELVKFDPESITVREDTAELYFISNDELILNLQPVTKADAKVVIDKIEDWNTSHGFYEPEEEDEDDKGWWTRNVSDPLAALLKETFNKTDESGELKTAGNIGYVWFYLSKKPEGDDKVVLNFSHERGDKSISLVRDYRYEFGSNNWNIPAIAAIQLDSKLDKPAQATFSGLSGNIRFAWTIVFTAIAVLFFLFFIYHRFILPKPVEDKPVQNEGKGFIIEFLEVFFLFFKKKDIWIIILFLLVYRLGESQLVKLASPFLLDSREMMGLGLTTGDIGLIYGTLGILFLTAGGIIGGIVASKKGLKYWLWWMVAAMNLPNLVYVYLSFTMPESLYLIGAAVAVEQFGYGFGFTAYMLYMIYVSDGKHKTAHFAMTTGIMALGMMIPGMVSGWLQEIIGYQNFFIWVMICTIPSFIIVKFINVDKDFGKK
ncbi:MAG: MFS transporter [Bacteroidota bacterium]